MSRFVATSLVLLVSLGCSKPAPRNVVLPPDPITMENPNGFFDPLNPVEERMEDQKRVEHLKWDWPPEEADLRHCVQKELSDYQTEIIHSKNGGGGLTLRIMKDGKEVYTFHSNVGTVLTRKGNVLFFAEFPGMTSGCSVFAYDIRAKKQLWGVGVRGMTPTHSFYQNVGTIATSGDAVVVKGKETCGNYIVYLNAETGKTIGRKEFRGAD